MPFNWSGQISNKVAKLGVVSDGNLYTVGSDGYTLTNATNPYSAFLQPVHSGTGVWSITTKDNCPVPIVVVISAVTASGYLQAQLRPYTKVTATGQTVVNWIFNESGTPTDLSSGDSFQVYFQYGETRTGSP